MNEKLIDNIKIWLPVIAIVSLVLFFGGIRMFRLYKLGNSSRSHFMKVCGKKHKVAKCKELLYLHHDTCFDLTQGLMRAGFRSSRVTIDLAAYESCTYDSSAYQQALAAKRAAKRAARRKR